MALAKYPTLRQRGEHVYTVATAMTSKASEKAALCWGRNKRKPAYKKIAGKSYWLNGDTNPRVPEGGPKRKK